jgi:molybdopterin/thiamine biosynthesis adenylyltransferase/rhodanese-related sulfurtransferase
VQASLSNAEIKRYSRHLILPEVGLSGQRKLKEASVLCIGVGGLGSPLSMYLAAAGVGRIGLVDFDVVDYSNLQRQILHYTCDVGKPKLESAAAKLRAINPEIEIELHNEAFTSSNAIRICEDYDIIADGTDNFPTRYLANDVCVLLGKPNVYTSIFRFEGQASVFDASKGPCYRCLYPEPPPPGMVPSCAEGGVLGVLPGIMGTIQATEVIKLILGVGEPLIGRLVLFNALNMRMREVQLVKDPDCPICGENPTIHELIDYDQFCGITLGPHGDELGEEWLITPDELVSQLNTSHHQVLIDVREPHEWEICHLPNARLIPEGQLQARINELNPEDEIILYCRTGVRSARALKLLRSLGFKKLKNLVGGIHGWSDYVDPSFPKY